MFINFVLFTIVLCLTATALAGPTSRPAPLYTGQWDIKRLKTTPRFIETREGNLSIIYYEGLPYKNHPTRVFAYLARPDNAPAKSPAIVLIHGGTGTAFKQWADIWAKRGYVALAMDLGGKGPDGKHMPDGGPPEGSQDRNTNGDFRDFWAYHAVADGMLGISLVSSLPDVDPKRIALTGISWGGFFTETVASLDDRVKVAVPVYGSGYINENNPFFANVFKDFTPAEVTRWEQILDPSSYLSECKIPMLFVAGASDPAYTIEARQKSLRLVKDHQLTLFPSMRHDHPDGWAPQEIYLFVDQYMTGGKALPRIISLTRKSETVRVKFQSESKVVKAELYYTTDVDKLSKDRAWQAVAGAISYNSAEAKLPSAKPMLYYMSIFDDRNAMVSTEYEELKP